MSIPQSLDQLQKQSYKEATSVANQVAVVVVNPDGSSITGAASGTEPVVTVPQSTSTYSLSLFTNFGVDATKNVKATPGNVYSLHCQNTTSSNRYIQLHNTATTPAGAAVPLVSFWVPPNSAVVFDKTFFGDNGINFSTGIAFAISSTIATYTAATNTDQNTTITYK
jgi:hypothetical protein